MSEPLRTSHDRRLRWAIGLAILLHGALLAFGSFRGTYDAWVHIFFGDHYARDWFSTWEPRWYTGFTVVSYPPASHQSIGLLSAAFGLQSAFVIVQLAAIVNLVVGVYRFSLLWVSRRAAGWAAILAVVSSSLAEVVHTFGQLPTTFALGFLLHAQPSISRWIRDGVRLELVAAIALTAATTAGHHVTTLFGSVFFTGPVAVRAVLDRWRVPLPGEPPGHVLSVRPALLLPQVARRLRRVLPALARAAVFGLLAISTLVTVVLPYWLWSSRDPITQVPIPHASRNDFLSDQAAGLVFWVVPWMGILVLAGPGMVKALLGRGWPLAASISLLTLLGTGGTTPIPRLLLRGAFDILTLDRFTIWATIAVLPFAGWAFESLRSGVLRDAVRARLGGMALRSVQTAVIAVALVSAVFAATLTAHRPFQPRAIDPAPISSFMDKDEHDRWRYLTLGFGDQMAWVAANTSAQTVDGNYHSARRLPELTSRSVERLEGAKYRGIPGLGSLQQFLITPSPYHLKFVFSVDRFYDPLLWSAGWQRIGRLDNDVEVWERADVPPLPDVLPVREIPGWQRLTWGILPLASVVAGVATLLWFASGRRSRSHATRGSGAGRFLAPVDRRLALIAGRLEGQPGLRSERASWSPTEHVVPRILEVITRPASMRSRAVGNLVVVVALVAPLTLLGTRAASPLGPAGRVEAYYDALDFQRFDEAHGMLDPARRPDLSDYLLDQSVSDGLVGGYSELDSVTSVIEQDGDEATARVTLTFVTAVAEYRVERQHELVRRSDQWYLTPDEETSPTAETELTVRPTIEVSTPTATVGDDGSAFDDVLDRPRVELGASTAYRVEGRWIVVGTVTNLDADPADVTVNATLRGADDELLASFDAGQSTVNQVLPGETVPYRVDVEGRAGSFDRDDPVAGDFDPLAFSAPVVDGEVARVDVSARAVVTGGQLERVLDVVGAVVVADDDARTIDVELSLRNAGTTPATVARVTVAYLDGRGRVRWVDHHWVPESVRPRQIVPGAWTSTLPALRSADVAIRLVDDVTGERDAAAAGGVDISLGDPTIEVDGHEITDIRLTVTSFQRETQP